MPTDYPPHELLRRVFSELQEELCQAVDRYCGRYTRDIESNAVSILMSSQEEMGMKVIHLEEGDKWFAEYGCTICDRGHLGLGYKLTDCNEGTTGSGVQIEDDACRYKERGRNVGTFHTHPYGSAAPSVGDIMNVFVDNRAVNFVGGVVGGRKVIVGYAPRPESIMKWEMKQRIAPYESACRAVTEYAVQFVFRMPGATSGAISLYNDTTCSTKRSN